MPDITRPIKTGGTTRYADEVAAGFDTMKSAEVDADLDLVYQTVNNLDNSNIADGANIDGDKIAAGTLPGAAITAGSITDVHINAAANIAASKLLAGSIMNLQVGAAAAIAGSKLANSSIPSTKLTPGASIRQFVGALVPGGLNFSTVETAVITFPPMTTVGGPIVILGMWPLSWVHDAPGTPRTLITRIRRSGTQVAGAAQTVAGYMAGDGASTAVPIGPPSGFDGPGAGTFTYTITLATSGVELRVISPVGADGAFWAIELA